MLPTRRQILQLLPWLSEPLPTTFGGTGFVLGQVHFEIEPLHPPIRFFSPPQRAGRLFFELGATQTAVLPDLGISETPATDTLAHIPIDDSSTKYLSSINYQEKIRSGSTDFFIEWECVPMDSRRLGQHHAEMLNPGLLKLLPFFPEPVPLIKRHGPQLRVQVHAGVGQLGPHVG